MTTAVGLCLASAAAAQADEPAPAAALEPEEGPEAPDALLGPVIREADLQPYFTSGPGKSVLQLLQQNQAARALTLLPAAPQGPLRWLRARALRAAGRPAEARKIYEALVVGGGPLVDRARHLAALCAEEAGDGAAAELLFGQVSLAYVDADQALLERARLQLKLRPSGPAVAKRVEETLQPLLDGRVKTDVALAHLLAGEAQAAAGAKEAARAHFRAAWVDHPLSGAALTARQRDQLLGGQPPPVPQEKLVQRAEALLEAHRNREALDQLGRLKLPALCTLGCPGDKSPAALLKASLAILAPQALPTDHQPTAEDVARPPTDPADPLACRARLDQGRALRKLHDYARARANLAPVVLRCADPDVRARALFLLAQLQSMATAPDAGPLWAALGERFPASSLADDALFNQAMVKRRAGDYAGERPLLQKLVDEHPDADTRAEALFHLFWSYHAEGAPRRGLAWLDQLAARPDPEGVSEERARYWRARTLLEPDPQVSVPARAAELEVARADLLWLVRERPLTYHGLLARGRLAELDPDLAGRIEVADAAAVAQGVKAGRALELHAGALATDPHLTAGIELLRLGQKSEAAREFSAVDRAPARAAGDAGNEPLVLLADLLGRAGEPLVAHQLVRTELRELLRRPARPLGLRAAALAYPLAFRDEIVKASSAGRIPPDLLQALMREESALDPKALSPVGALGLTQLMPPTARAVARKLKLKAFRVEQLLEPGVNIRLGGSYLGELYAHFGHPAPTLASYNAGPGAVGGWLRARGTMPMDAWVEEIPLDETRGYVKRCLRSYAVYQYLYGTGGVRLAKVPQQLAQR